MHWITQASRRFIWLFFMYNGRLARLPYSVGLFCATLTPGAIVILFEDPRALAEKEWTPLSVSIAIIIVWTMTALLVKRLRDAGLGWPWVFLLALPALQLVVLFGFAIPKGKPLQPVP